MATTGMIPTDLREVPHCPVCGRPLIRVPVLTCARCGEERRLRCFVYQWAPEQFVAECIDLDLLSQGITAEEAIGKLQEAVHSYLEVAFEGETKGLVLRRSPVSHRLRYHAHCFRERLRDLFRRQHGRHFILTSVADRTHRFSHC